MMKMIFRMRRLVQRKDDARGVWSVQDSTGCRTEGAEALSMRRMADALGITATALYRHYGGKDDLLDAVANRGIERLASDFRGALKKRTPRARLIAVFEAFRAFAPARRPPVTSSSSF